MRARQPALSIGVPDKIANAASGSSEAKATSQATMAPWENPPTTKG
jgi:hypothetical protein